MTWDYAAFAPRSQEEGSNIDFKDLSPELREKAKACKTPDEMLALAKQEGYKLSPFFCIASIAPDGSFASRLKPMPSARHA